MVAREDKVVIIKPTPYQIILIAVTALIVSMFLYLRMQERVIADPKPPIKYYVPKAESEVDIIQAVVSTGISIQNFSTFDPVNNRFVIDGSIWFIFDPVAVTLDTISNFSFQKGKFLKKLAPNLKVIGENIMAIFDISVEFSTPLDYRYFPFDDHRVELMLVNEFATINELKYVARIRDVYVSHFLFAGGYHVRGQQVAYGYIGGKESGSDGQILETNPVALFTVDFEQAGAHKALLIVIPLILLFFVGLFSLMHSPLSDRTFGVRLGMGALTAILAYRFVIESLAPKVGYSTITDYLFYFVLVVVFSSFGLVIAILSRATARFNERTLRQVSASAGCVLLIVVTYYLFFFWGR